MNELVEVQKRERELLHQQLELLAEKSQDSDCSVSGLALISEQMVNIFTALKP